ncbi:hypothetical protein, partial [Lactococcus lactis]|uniref:hypothetical protein n=1 Tax=Lactococcus lactis TaxID=1358 RepID=UPI00223B3697
MTETAKSKIKNFKNQITEKFNVGEVNGFRTYIGKLSPVNVLDMLDDIERSITTGNLSVEKLQEHLLPYKKEMVQKIIDEKMQLVTADEFLKLHKESLTAIRENDKLQEQLNTAKKALTEISEDVPKPPKYNLNAEFWRTQWSEAS